MILKLRAIRSVRIMRSAVVLLLIACAAPVLWRIWRSEAAWWRVRDAGEIRIGIDPSMQPMSFYAANGWDGWDADLSAALAADLELRLVVIPVGYDARYDALQAGRIDLYISAATPEEVGDIGWSAAYLDVGPRLIAPSVAAISNVDQLAGRRVGVALGGAADRSARHWERRIAGMRRIAVEDDTAVLHDLQAGRMDAAVVAGDAALRFGCPVTRSGDAGRWHCVAIAPMPYAVAARMSEARLLREVNAALQRLRAQDLPSRLRAKWFPSVSVP